VAKCTVSYTDSGGVEHVVEVTAGSLFEAAALGLEAFAAGELTESRPAPATILEIVATPVPVTHRVRVSQPKEWLKWSRQKPEGSSNRGLGGG
jgi:hypothetical protein